MNARNPSRRGVMAGIVAVPSAAVPAIRAAPHSNGAAAFDKAYSLAMIEEARADHFDRTVYEPREAAYMAAAEKIPHIRADYVHASGAPSFLSTASHQNVSTAAALIRAISPIRPRLPHTQESSYARACRKITAHNLWRNRHLKRLRAELGFRDAIDRSDALGEASHQALVAMIATPAATPEQALRKVETILERREEADEADLTVIVADLRRTIRPPLAVRP